MNVDLVEKIANAVLYEGYILYPYRPSAIKNQQRFNFGVLYPRAYSEAQGGSDAFEMQTECLLETDGSASIDVKVRFLQLAQRENWQEGHDRAVFLAGWKPKESANKTIRQQVESVEVELELGASQISNGLVKICVRVRNAVRLENVGGLSRDQVLLRSMVSVHTILHADEGQFVSSLDPPDPLRDAVASCSNSGTWPVLVGEEGQRDTILSAPIILYDYPQIAPESPGDLCDGTEIDEILALRILTMTDAEKTEVRNSDERARKILERTEMMPPEHFQKLHGVLRGMRVLSEETNERA